MRRNFSLGSGWRRWRSPRRPYHSGGGLDTVMYRDPLLAARVTAERNRPTESIVRETSDPWRSIEFRIVRLPDEPWSDDGHRNVRTG
jgi:hypothetical protein